MALDTLSYARRLRQAGMPEAIADATRDFVLEDVATNAHLARAEESLKAKIGRVERELKAEITSMRAEMAALEQRVIAAIEAQALRLTVRMGIMLAAGLSLVTALIGLMLRLR
jgi:hypothetical protein